ncbi:hypothetical protein X474_19935 [Dethiosulfatarculus sandiegensis]|uniref:Uncharacterized protein n=1 Tax=Dethiosulfatarculus sandiegensis TaxID=1429043 RepID=A0A0D2J982_9BACT|nr:hypothetical protein X474_19935 [Dethiosulfatarculus sandiegensis]
MPGPIQIKTPALIKKAGVFLSDQAPAIWNE